MATNETNSPGPWLYQHRDGRHLVAKPDSPTIAGADAADYINRQIALLQWIESNKLVVEELAWHRMYSTTLNAGLTENDIRLGIEWDDRHSGALCDLLRDIADRAVDLVPAKEVEHV